MSNGGSPFRVGIDGFNLAIPRGTGVATYARSLAAVLTGMGHPVDVLYGMDINPADPPIERQVAFFDQLHTQRGYKPPRYPSVAWARAMGGAWRGQSATSIPLDGTVEARPMADRLPTHDRILNAAKLFGLAGQFFRNFGRFVSVRMPDPPAVMHWTYPVPVRVEGARNIYTVHDLVPLRLPYATLDHKPTHLRLLRECVRTGDGICTVSERSREDMLTFVPDADPARVTNTYQAVVAPRLPGAPDRLLEHGFGLRKGGYFLFFGSVEPKKNLSRLLQAVLEAGLDIPLVVVTARGWQSDAEAALLDNRPKDDPQIRQIEYVPPDMLAVLVAGARAVTFPSIYEGFGLPVLEAMLLGTPVLTSREGSLPEVAGTAAEFVDAFDVNSIVAGLRRLATDDARCAALSAAGRVQAEQFSVSRYEERLRALYDRVLSQPARP